MATDWRKLASALKGGALKRHDQEIKQQVAEVKAAVRLANHRIERSAEETNEEITDFIKGLITAHEQFGPISDYRGSEIFVRDAAVIDLDDALEDVDDSVNTIGDPKEAIDALVREALEADLQEERDRQMKRKWREEYGEEE